jgi:hypothetical protein
MTLLVRSTVVLRRERTMADERTKRILAIVFASDTVIRPSQGVYGHVVVVNGLTGLDACARTAEECFDILLAEEDGQGSPGRIAFGFTPAGGPTLVLREPVDVSQLRRADGGSDG